MAKRIILLLNSAAGTAQRIGVDTLRKNLTEAASWADVEVRLMDEGPMEAATAACRANPDIIAIAGGDGTARCAAQALASTGCGSALIPLPLGTANLLPHRLYGDRTPEEILSEAHGYEPVKFHAGAVGDQLFFIAATAGFPSRLAEAREEARPGGRKGRRMRAAWAKMRAAMKIAFQPRLRVHLDDRPELFSRASAAMFVPGGIEDAFGVDHIEPGRPQLECFAFSPRNVGDAASLTVMALAQRWREHPRVAQAWADHAALTGRRRIPIMLDGEPSYIKPPVKIELRPEAVRFLAPRP